MDDIKIIFKDQNFIVLDKPAGVLCHPTPAKENNTVVDFLIQNHLLDPKLAWPEPERAGIVHRLDKETSGLLLVAQTPEMLKMLQALFQKRQIKKTYLALVLGKLPKTGRIDAPILRGKAGLQKVGHFDLDKTLKPAVTCYETIKYFTYQKTILTFVKALPQTGRMHQIRTHFKYLGFPILGDPLYNTKESRKLSKTLNLSHQFLHASELRFNYPVTDKPLVFKADLPKDLENIYEILERQK